jgi:hypothetical protein
MALTTKDIADEFGTDSKTLRKFLRSHMPKDAQPGQGGRYAFEKKDLAGLKKAWMKWSENKVDKDEPTDADAKAPTKTKRSRAKKDEAPAEVDEVDDDEPDEDALAELEDEDVEDLDDLLDEVDGDKK